MDQARQAVKPDDPRVKAALAEYMERTDRGEQVDRQQFLAAHADIADELSSFIATSEELARLVSPARQDAEAQSISTRSLAERDQETLIPQRVKGDVKETQSLGLPPQFGRYKILKPLGSGAMGMVYLAEDTQLERKVALKTPSFDEDETGELLQRFYREARSAATLRHPHICPVHDVGEIGGKHFITMAYIEGRPLSAYIRPDKLQPERQTLVAVRKLALALQEAHDHNIIHRDLKPGNIMIDGKGEPIVMDFGLARKVHREETSRLTQSGMIVGSPAYMSPEQVEGEPDKLGPAADQYSLGVILYELLTGQLPFRGSVTAVIGAILTKEPTPVAELRAGIDPRVAALCARMMHKNASERYPSMKAVAEAIAGILKEAPSEALKETVRTVERPAKPQAAQGAKVEKGAEAPAAVSITASNVASLYEAAQKCMRKHDYEQVVQMLQQVPETKRTEEVRALLARARQLADEVAFLLAEIDEAARVNDNAALAQKTDALLKLKPKHHKALQIKEELSRYGTGKLWKAGGYTPDGRRIGEGSWIPWLGIGVGIIAFATALWAVTIYLKAGDAVVRVQISNPDVKVEFQNRTLNIQSANKEFKVEPGENTLKITYGGSEFETDKFTLKDGENPVVVVELLDKTLAAKFGEESIGSWEVQTPESSQAAGKEPVYELRTYTCLPGRFEALIARFRDHTVALFQKHGITSVAYWTPTEEPEASNTLLVLLRYESREAATRSWQAFQNDPEWRQLLAAEAEPEGRITARRPESVSLKLGDSSPIPGPVSSDKVYELRVASASAENVPDLNDQSHQQNRVRLLARHGIKAYASFAATDETLSESNRYHILEYQDEGSFKSARQALIDDPEYKAMRAEREAAGNLAESATSMFLRSAEILTRPSVVAAGNIPSGRYDVLFNKDQGWLYTYRIDADRFVRETVDILGSGKGPQPLTEGRGTIEKLAAGKFRLTYDPSTWNGKPPAEVWTAKGADGSYTTEYWFPAENYAAQKPPNLTGVVTLHADSASPGSGWTDLFNGRDLTGWTVHRNQGPQPVTPWTADSGRQVIVAQAGGQNWLESDQTYHDFTLALEWRFTPGGSVAVNGSGIVVRADGLNSINFDPKGIEIDLMKSADPANQRGTGGFYTYDTSVQHRGGATPDRGNGNFGPMSPPVVFNDGQWNNCEITCQGDRISVRMNDVLVNEAWGAPERAGKICLRNQNSDVEFRDIRIRPIGSANKEADAAAALQGSWTAVAQEVAGGVWTQEQIAEHEKSVKFAGDTFEIRYRDRMGLIQVERGTFRLDLTHDPAYITMNGTERGGRAIEFLGIYQIEGDELRHCFVKVSNGRAAARPSGFSTTAGSGQFSTTYRRD